MVRTDKGSFYERNGSFELDSEVQKPHVSGKRKYVGPLSQVSICF